MRSIPQYLLKTNPSKPIIQYQFWFWCMSNLDHGKLDSLSVGKLDIIQDISDRTIRASELFSKTFSGSAFWCKTIHGCAELEKIL